MIGEFPDVTFLFFYTREAHPGEHHAHHTSIEQKLTNAREMAEAFGIKRDILVDDLDGTLHQQYGTLWNMAYIINIGGSVLYRAAWTDPRTIRMALEQFVYERDQRRAGERPMPYYLEWQPGRFSDQHAFLEGIYAVGGPKAAIDFINVIGPLAGDVGARRMKEWWATKPESKERAVLA